MMDPAACLVGHRRRAALAAHFGKFFPPLPVPAPLPPLFLLSRSLVPRGGRRAPHGGLKSVRPSQIGWPLPLTSDARRGLH